MTATTTAAVTEEKKMITPPLSPSFSSDERVVRFDNECVLIPEPARKPKMVTKSYTLPLWKKKGQNSGPVSDAEVDEDIHLVLKVPVPSFMSKPRSPVRDHAQPLSPCLVRRQTAASSPSRPIPVRQSSLNNILPRTDVVTIPLRSCCNNCVHTTEESLREGIEWHEKFSRAARRKRSRSLDSSGFTAICEDPEAGSSFSAKFAISVDEVEKRWKSHEPMAGVNHEQEQSTSSTDSDSNQSLGNSSSKQAEKVVPILEEDDDDQLFPLPSPRRTPTSSPVPSPTASLSCLDASTSRDSLPNSNRGSICSFEDPDLRVGKGRCTKGLLTPDESPLIPSYVPQGLHVFPSSTPSPTRTQHTRDSLPNTIPPSSKDAPRTPSNSPERKRHRSSFTPTQLFKVGAEALKGVSTLSNGSTSLRI